MIDRLVGHTLNKFEFNYEDETISITIDGDKVYLIKVDADCCSSGKFLGVGYIYDDDLPSKIVSCEEVNQQTDLPSDGLYQVYSHKLTLENGEQILIVYDNKSNGYYGSSLEIYYEGSKDYDLESLPI